VCVCVVCVYSAIDSLAAAGGRRSSKVIDACSQVKTYSLKIGHNVNLFLVRLTHRIIKHTIFHGQEGDKGGREGMIEEALPRGGGFIDKHQLNVYQYVPHSRSAAAERRRGVVGRGVSNHRVNCVLLNKLVRLLELAISSNFLGLSFLAVSTDVAKSHLTPSLPAVIPVIRLFFLIFSQPARLNKDMLRRHFGRTRGSGGLFSVRSTGQHKQEKVFAMPVRPVATQSPRCVSISVCAY
jgi:hypothetical protein